MIRKNLYVHVVKPAIFAMVILPSFREFLFFGGIDNIKPIHGLMTIPFGKLTNVLTMAYMTTLW